MCAPTPRRKGSPSLQEGLMRKLLLSSIVLLVSAVPALAQRTTGSLVGTVTDDSGSVLPGAIVSVKGPTVVGPQTATTNERGFYRFPALPPGLYTVSFALQGFRTVNRSDVRLSLGATLEENVALKISQMSEEVTVAA